MTPRFLLDTAICSYVIKGSHPTLDRHLRELHPRQVAISAVTRAELRFGIALRPEATRLARLVESFLQFVVTLPWDAPAADRYGSLRAMLHQAGQPIGDHDTMIAAHALTMNATLITHNLAHFERVSGLSCTDWTHD
jgi:tRNA(fMet)-specific endonuclease VapC